MALDYKNLPLLMTIEDVAEVFRCETGTVRRKLKIDPGWLQPVRFGLMRRQLFATVDVMALLGHAAPAHGPAPLQDHVDPWDLGTATDLLEQAVTDRKHQQMVERNRKYLAASADWDERIKTHAPSARLNRIGWSSRKAHIETSNDGEAFRVSLRFQPRHRPHGWPAHVSIPRDGPEWVALDTDVEMDAMIAEVDEIMADYQPRWDAAVEDSRQARKAAKAQKKKPDG